MIVFDSVVRCLGRHARWVIKPRRINYCKKRQLLHFQVIFQRVPLSDLSYFKSLSTEAFDSFVKLLVIEMGHKFDWADAPRHALGIRVLHSHWCDLVLLHPPESRNRSWNRQQRFRQFWLGLVAIQKIDSATKLRSRLVFFGCEETAIWLLLLLSFDVWVHVHVLLFGFLLLDLQHLHVSCLANFMWRIRMQHSSLSKHQLRLIVGAILASLSWLSKQPWLFKNISKVNQTLVRDYLVHVVDPAVEVHFSVKLFNLRQPLPVTFSHIVFIGSSVCLAKFSFNHILKWVGYLVFLSCNFSNETSSIQCDRINWSKLKSRLKALGNESQQIEL